MMTNKEEEIKVTKKKNLENDIEDETLEIDEIVNIKESRNHPLENVIGNLNQRTLRSQAQNQSNFFCFISTIKPKNVNEALTDNSWIVAMQEELNQFIANDVWELVPQPRNMTIIGTKWVFRNKLDENGIVSRNKARLVAQGYNQQEGIDYDETYAPVARLESIRILLAYACALYFKLFQMDVKSAFLNGFINGEVYVAQPPGFIDFEKPDHVYKLKKALYGVKQAPKACFVKFECLLEINDQICPRFILEFFNQYQLNYSDEGQMFVKFVIQNQFFSCSLKDFAQILDIPCEGACVFTDKWSLDELAYGVPTDGPYQTNPPFPDDIISSIRIDQEGQVNRIRHKEEIDGHEYQILTRKILITFKPLEEIIRENVSVWGGSCHESSLPLNKSERLERILAREEVVTPLLLPPPLINHPPLILTMMIMEMTKGLCMQWANNRWETDISKVTLYDCHPDIPFLLLPPLTNHSSSYLNDDDDGNGEGTSRASTSSPIRYVNLLTNEVP
ncbi:retrovirus-related pol polyprotein from transposon TNT 1-94 [Tanacetum coccineum]